MGYLRKFSTLFICHKYVVFSGNVSSDVTHILSLLSHPVSSKDILMRVIAQNLPPESTPVEKVCILLFLSIYLLCA